MPSDSNLNQKILQCIEDGLQALGDSGKHAVYYHLEKKFGLKRKKIPEKPEMFLKGLVSIFGEEGAGTLQNLIVQKLKSNFNLKRKSESTLAETVAMIKARQKEASKLERR